MGVTEERTEETSEINRNTLEMTFLYTYVHFVTQNLCSAKHKPINVDVRKQLIP